MTEGADYFYQFRKTFHHHRIVINPKIEFESKGIPVFFLLSLILFTALTKKKTTNEWVEKKKESITKPQNFPTIPTIHHYYNKPFMYLIGLISVAKIVFLNK